MKRRRKTHCLLYIFGYGLLLVSVGTMKKQNENLFREKFRLLNSQELTEDIKWSSSSSSEPESTVISDKSACCNEERKRYRKRKCKKNVSKNVSNLDITFVDSCKNKDSFVDIEKSPILKPCRIVTDLSPVLSKTSFPPNRNTDTISPILSTKRLRVRSPVLSTTSNSPNYSGRVRKKLCYEKDKSKKNHTENKYLDDNINNIDTRLDNSSSEANSITLNESNSSIKSKLMIKVKNYFDSHFSSEATSQNISTTDTTPSEDSCCNNEDVEILSCKTQTVTNLHSVKSEITNSDITIFDRSIKKPKYKKGGLAFRLNALVKKQNAHISLWQHERFLANNSNFVIPKEEHFVFRIQTFQIQYGCYVFKAVDCESKKFLILINKKHMNVTIVDNCVLKLYEPFHILSSDSDIKIIVNVCKFECVVIKS